MVPTYRVHVRGIVVINSWGDCSAEETEEILRRLWSIKLKLEAFERQANYPGEKAYEVRFLE